MPVAHCCPTSSVTSVAGKHSVYDEPHDGIPENVQMPEDVAGTVTPPTAIPMTYSFALSKSPRKDADRVQVRKGPVSIPVKATSHPHPRLLHEHV